MKRGEVWLISGGAAYVKKPRPVVVIQDDAFAHTESVTVCPFTSRDRDVPLVRPVVEPAAQNGLRSVSRLMADKISTVPRERLSKRIGELAEDDLTRLGRAVIVFLRLGPTKQKSSRRKLSR